MLIEALLKVGKTVKLPDVHQYPKDKLYCNLMFWGITWKVRKRPSLCNSLEMHVV